MGRKNRPAKNNSKLSKFTKKTAKKNEEYSSDEEPTINWDKLGGAEKEKFESWGGDKTLAKLLKVADVSYEQWDELMRPWPRKSCKLSLDNIENIKEQIQINKVAALNRKLQKTKPIETYDEKNYTSPGVLLTRMLNRAEVDLDRVRVVDKGLVGLMEIADKDHEAADWELKNNDWTERDPSSRQSRLERKKKAEVEIETRLEEYNKLEVLKQIEEAKAGDIKGILQVVDPIANNILGSNDLCAELWKNSKDDAGQTGQIQSKDGYSAEVLREAWKTWKQFQRKMETSPVAGFQTWAIGNGTAQDKSDREDAKTRNHKFQMNFAVVWRGVKQMIHVGLEGT